MSNIMLEPNFSRKAHRVDFPLFTEIEVKSYPAKDMWTSLVGITSAMILSLAKSLIYLPLYLAWVLGVRVLQMGFITWLGHLVSMRTIPLMLYSQWIGALVKIRASFHLAEQRWGKSGSVQRGDANTIPIPHPLSSYMPSLTMVFSFGLFIFVMLIPEKAISLPEAEIDARSYGVIPNDGRDDAIALQAILDHHLPSHGRVTLKLPSGTLDFFYPVVISRSEIWLRGEGVGVTYLVSHLGTSDRAMLLVRGEQAERIGYLDVPLAAGDKRLPYLLGVAAGDSLLLRQPNDTALFDRLGSLRWRRDYPYLRQAIVRIKRIDSSGTRIGAPTGIDFDAHKTEIYRLRPVRSVRISDFTLRQQIDHASREDVRFRYENLYPDKAVDLIALEWTTDARIERVHLLDAGRHPLSVENSYGFRVRDFLIDGAWNKGDNGNGYLRIARSYHGLIERGTVRNIRHIAVQWSAAYNRLQDLKSEVDLNFHGGLSHHNVARRIQFALPERHPWPAVFRTPPDAGWAPPDGPGNIVE